MSVLKRATLEASPLADLHALASELAIDGYRRLRREELIDAILSRHAGGRVAAADQPDGDRGETDEPRQSGETEEPRRSRRRGGRARAGAEAAEGGREEAPLDAAAAEQEAAGADDATAGPTPRRPRRGQAAAEPSRRRERREQAATGPSPRRGRREQGAAGEAEPISDELLDVAAEAAERAAAGAEGEEIVEGVVELLPNGSGFLRVHPPDPSDDDVYISAAQVKRCELVSGDRVSGPRRAPRRSERFPSLVRIDTINGAPASELAEGLRYEELPAEFPNERFKLGSQDPTVKAIEWLTPFGRGSRVCIVGPSRAGKSEALRRLLEALAGDERLHCSLVLAGVRPEEIALWGRGPVRPLAAVSLAQPGEAQLHAVELAVEQAKRLAARGAHALVAIDTLDALPPASARKALAAARNISDGGSLTVIATAREPIGGETTVITLDLALASTGRYPALDLTASGTIHDELLVGTAGSQAIARARLEAIEGPEALRRPFDDEPAKPSVGGDEPELALGGDSDGPLPPPVSI
jgi:transcription termination factor Rho